MKRVVAQLSAAALLTASSTAQGPCFDSASSTASAGFPTHVALADVDGDGSLEAAVTCSGGFAIHAQNGHGVFAAPQTYPWPSPLVGSDWPLVATDFEGDGDTDFIARQSGLQVFVDNGGGAFAGQALSTPATEGDFACGDVDGDGDADVVTVAIDSFGARSLSVLFQGPAGVFTSYGFEPLTGSTPTSLALADVDGDGDRDLVAALVHGQELRIYRNDGTGTLALVDVRATGLHTQDVELADLDGDGDLDLATLGGAGADVSLYRNVGGVTFASPTVHSFNANVVGGSLASGDFDGDGDVDVAFDGYFPEASGGSFDVQILDNRGAFVFAVGLRISAGTLGVVAGDLDRDGDVDLVGVGSTSNSLQSFRSCSRSGVPICAGDGSGASCPCGNSSAPGSGAGCRNSVGLDGRLRGAGAASVGADGLVLTLDGAPSTTTALFFQGTRAAGGGAGVAFGDGLRCAGGAIVRLGTSVCSGGVAVHPATSGASISTTGAVTSGDERVYQTWYRNSASFCTPASFNLSNGLRVAWGS